jgi:alpha/beta superfamily hydrolase
VNLDLQGPAGRLEALLDLPASEARAAAVLAHPHPQHGGTMRARVAHEAARGFRNAGAAVLRFNFRGVGRSAGSFSDGIGEAEDYRAALEAMARRCPGRPIWAAGYSFGAWVALAEGAADQRVTALIGIAPLVEHYDFATVVGSPKAKFLIQAERDEFCPVRAMHRFYGQLAEPKELIVIDAADHAFDGRANEVGDASEDLFGDFDR